MKKKSLRILSLIVAIVMVVAMLPLSALAEETKPTRKVGVVVYGAELTAILTNIDKSIKDGVSSIENGDAEAAAENTKSSLETLVELATSFTTGAIDGTGFSVPDLDLEIKDENGTTYSMTETPVEIFSQTTEMDLPLQEDLEDRLDQLDKDIADLQKVLNEWNPINEAIDVININGKIHDLSNNIGAVDFQNLTSRMSEVVNKLVGDLAKVSGLEGKLYRTYVVDKELVIGDTYTAYIKGFTDTDENGNPATRDGYIVYNDGLTKEEGGSMFNTTRSFRFEVEPQGRFDHEIQFVGPKAGIEGTLSLDENFTNAYDNLVNGVNTLITTLTDTRSWLNEGRIATFIKTTLSDLFDAKDLINWFETRSLKTLKTSSEIDKHYEFTFPGLWCAESEAGFAFTDVDVAETGITGSEYLLVNRDELIDVLKFMKELGKDAFQGALKATFGGTATYADGTVKDYDSIVNLYFELVKSEDGQLSLDYDTAFAILKTYLGVISDMNLFDRVVDTDTGDMVPMKLKYPIPAFLQATSDENGIVKFNRNSNVTLTWMLQIIPQITNALGDASFVQDNQVLSLLVKVANYAAPIVKEYGEKIINTLVYPFAQRLGLVGKKMASGNYIMFQTKAAEGYWINPLAYTMILTWENDTWLYVTVADLGLIMPYFFEGFYEFVRNTTFAGTIDKFLNQITGKETNLITNILTDKIDITAEMGKVVTGALTAFVGQIGFESLGLDTIFATKSDFVAGLNKYLYENGRTAQNLMIYVNQQAMRAKAVYTGYVTENWYFYNLDKSPTTTATKLIDKSTKNIAAAFVNPTKSEIVTKTGNTVKSIVSTIGYKVEETAQNIRTQVKSTIGAAIQSVVQKAFDSVKTSVTNFVKDMFSRLIHA